MTLKLMADRYGYLKAVEEVQDDWLENLLAFLGVDFQEVNEMTAPEFVDYLKTNNVGITRYPTLGALSVEFEGEVVGEWASPELTMKSDPETGELYYEIEIENWSIMEEDIDLSS